jgi:hypothetical protein
VGQRDVERHLGGPDFDIAPECCTAPGAKGN